MNLGCILAQEYESRARKEEGEVGGWEPTSGNVWERLGAFAHMANWGGGCPRGALGEALLYTGRVWTGGG